MENLETMKNICKKVITGEWKIYYHIFVAYKMYLQMRYLQNMKINRADELRLLYAWANKKQTMQQGALYGS